MEWARRWQATGVGLLLAVGYAALAVGSGLDRAAPLHPGLASHVPGWARAETASAEAHGLIAAGIPASALNPAREAVTRNPGDGASLALLGTALLARRQAAEADRAFRIAAQGGWRDVLAQTYWLKIALASGDYGAAVLRFDALARQYPKAPAIAAAAGLLEATPEGRSALARQLAGGTNWTEAYAALDGEAPADQLTRRAQVLLETARLGRPLGCATVGLIVSGLAVTDPLAGAQVWRAHCPAGAASGALVDGSFDNQEQPGPRVPFEWDFPGDGAIETGFASTSPSDKLLTIRTAAAVPLPVAAQLVPLRPGTYRVSWQGTPARLRASVTCRRDVSPPLPAPPVSGRGAATFSVDGSCAARWLQLWIVPGAQQVTLDDVRLEKLR